MTVSSTSHNAVLTQREQNLTRALNAADGALEYAYASWKGVIGSNALRPPTNAEITITAPTASLHSGFVGSGVTFSGFSVVNANQWGETTDGSGVTITNPVNVQIANVPGHPGWTGNASFYRARG